MSTYVVSGYDGVGYRTDDESYLYDGKTRVETGLSVRNIGALGASTPVSTWNWIIDPTTGQFTSGGAVFFVLLVIFAAYGFYQAGIHFRD